MVAVTGVDRALQGDRHPDHTVHPASGRSPQRHFAPAVDVCMLHGRQLGADTGPVERVSARGPVDAVDQQVDAHIVVERVALIAAGAHDLRVGPGRIGRDLSNHGTTGARGDRPVAGSINDHARQYRLPAVLVLREQTCHPRLTVVAGCQDGTGDRRAEQHGDAGLGHHLGRHCRDQQHVLGIVEARRLRIDPDRVHAAGLHPLQQFPGDPVQAADQGDVGFTGKAAADHHARPHVAAKSAQAVDQQRAQAGAPAAQRSEHAGDPRPRHGHLGSDRHTALRFDHERRFGHGPPSKPFIRARRARRPASSAYCSRPR